MSLHTYIHTHNALYMQPNTIPLHLTRPRRANRLDPRDLKVQSKVCVYVLLRGNVYVQNPNLDFI